MDYDKASTLLNIVEKCAGHSGKLMHISNAAMKELLEMNEGIREDVVKSKEREEQQAARRTSPRTQEAIAAEVERRNAQRREAALQAAGEGDVKPNVYPGSSETATIADRRV